MIFDRPKGQFNNTFLFGLINAGWTQMLKKCFDIHIAKIVLDKNGCNNATI